MKLKNSERGILYQKYAILLGVLEGRTHKVPRAFQVEK